MTNREIIKVNLEELAEGKIFDRDELVVFLGGGWMETIRRESESDEITHYIYHLQPNEGGVYCDGHGEIDPDIPDYKIYKQKLMGAGLWH